MAGPARNSSSTAASRRRVVRILPRRDNDRHGVGAVSYTHLDVYKRQAEYLGLTRGTVSQTLTVLERKGLIVRTPDDRHGKRIHLTLSAAGEAVLNASWSQRVDQALATAGGDSPAFGNDLRGVLSALQRLNGKQAFGQCRQCAHFLGDDGDYRCGLTGEALAVEQTIKICREWTSPDTRMSAAGRLATHR